MGGIKAIEGRPGANPLTDAGAELVAFSRLVLSAGQSYSGAAAGHEMLAVILSGQCTIGVSGQKEYAVVARQDPFSAKPHALYLPPALQYAITAETDLEVGLCSARGDSRGEPVLIEPAQIEEGVWGVSNYATRYRMILPPHPASSPAKQLIAGETVTPSGHWSTYPPHKHDESNLPVESRHEEIYFFKVVPEDGFGLMRVYDYSGLDQCFTIRNNTALSVPHGFHTMVSVPGCEIYALWFVGGADRRISISHDPALAWVVKAERMLRRSV